MVVWFLFYHLLDCGRRLWRSYLKYTNEKRIFKISSLNSEHFYSSMIEFRSRNNKFIEKISSSFNDLPDAFANLPRSPVCCSTWQTMVPSGMWPNGMMFPIVKAAWQEKLIIDGWNLASTFSNLSFHNRQIVQCTFLQQQQTILFVFCIDMDHEIVQQLRVHHGPDREWYPEKMKWINSFLSTIEI